jgi:hypothetical protein
MRKSPHRSATAGPSVLERALPPSFRGRLEAARLDLRALFRAADQLGIAHDLPDEITQLFELDADLAEALHVMDLAPGGIDVRAMLRDTEASLASIAASRAEFLDSLAGPARKRLQARVPAVRATLLPQDAYIDIPGRDPRAS